MLVWQLLLPVQRAVHRQRRPAAGVLHRHGLGQRRHQVRSRGGVPVFSELSTQISKQLGCVLEVADCMDSLL